MLIRRLLSWLDRGQETEDEGLLLSRRSFFFLGAAAGIVVPTLTLSEVGAYEGTTFYGYSAAAALDAELRLRAAHTSYFNQMTLGIAKYGSHRSDRLLFDKLARLRGRR